MYDKFEKGKTILVALSGGVDSSVAAAKLVREGHTVTAAYMKNWINEDNILGDCPWQQDIRDAEAVSDQLGIEFRVVNLMEEYRERIVDYLLAGYQAGITPNPDAMCNREMKFGVFLDYALEHGFSAVATGHYARRQTNVSKGGADILMGADPNKDQSYFLALMNQHQAAHALFPIGELPKPEVRELAHTYGLPTAAKKDSQGICFIGQVKMSDFLAAYVDDVPGPIVDLDGKQLGDHRGLHYFTLGQRKGLGVASNAYKEHYVVVEKRKQDNALVVAFDRKDTPKLWARRCTIGNLSWVNHPVTEACDIQARPRYRAPAAAIRFEPAGDVLADGTATVTFAEPQRALTPGQVIAFYDGEVLLGGGFFLSVDYEDTSSGS